MKDIAQKLISPRKGIFAADQTKASEAQHQLRRSIMATSGQEDYISGIIFAPADIDLMKTVGERGIIPIIKVDRGLDDQLKDEGELRSRLQEYKEMGALATKWRSIDNPDVLARFAQISQEEGLLPIVEPEVLMADGRTIDEYFELTKKFLKSLFAKLNEDDIDLTTTLLKTNMVLPGGDEEVAQQTLNCLKQSVPRQVPGIFFLSGGQEASEATRRLNSIVISALQSPKDYPWRLSFSFGRALQTESVDEYLKRARLNSLASVGKWNSALES